MQFLLFSFIFGFIYALQLFTVSIYSGAAALELGETTILKEEEEFQEKRIRLIPQIWEKILRMKEIMKQILY